MFTLSFHLQKLQVIFYQEKALRREQFYLQKIRTWAKNKKPGVVPYGL